MHALIAVLAGDGIGVEVTAEAVRALEAIAARFGHTFAFEPALLGGAAIDATGEPLPAATLEICRRADAVLLGAVGGPKWSAPDAKVRPEQGLLALRKALGLFANLRPVVPHPAVLEAGSTCARNSPGGPSRRELPHSGERRAHVRTTLTRNWRIRDRFWLPAGDMMATGFLSPIGLHGHRKR